MCVMKSTWCTIYSVTIHLHVSGSLVFHLQVVTMYICNNWHALYVLVDCQLAILTRLRDSQLKPTTSTILLHIYVVNSWWWATFFFPIPPYVPYGLRGLPSRSVTDVHKGQLRCPDEVDGDTYKVPGEALNLRSTTLSTKVTMEIFSFKEKFPW
jgi:hypothetical protein